MLFDILLLLVSFALLYFGADWLIRGASAVALHLKVSKVVVGLTMVAFGTSAPELFVNLIAAVRGSTGFALSNISGSNLANICLGFGGCALIGTLIVEKRHYLSDLALFLVAPLLVTFFLWGYPGGRLPLWSVGFFMVMFAYYFLSLKKRIRREKNEILEKATLSLWTGLCVFAIGVLSLYIAGELILKSAKSIGATLGISETVLGLTVVAVGTSLPDITASLLAIRKQETTIAVGNLLGSNIFNILLILSATMLASGGSLEAELAIQIDYIMVAVASILFFAMAFWAQRITKPLGLLLVAIYVGYLAFRLLVLRPAA